MEHFLFCYSQENGLNDFIIVPILNGTLSCLPSLHALWGTELEGRQCDFYVHVLTHLWIDWCPAQGRAYCMFLLYPLEFLLLF